MRFFAMASAAVIALNSTFVRASESNECHSIAVAMERLACYDRISDYAGAKEIEKETGGVDGSAFTAALAVGDAEALIASILSSDDAPIASEADIDNAEAMLLAHTKPLPASNVEANLRGYQALAKLRPNNSKYHQKVKSYTDALDRQKYAILTKLKTTYVEFDKRTWYKHRSKPRYADTRNYLQIYIGEKNGRILTRLQLNYTDDNWLFVHSAVASIDGKRVPLPLHKWERDNDSEIWEWADVVLTAELRDIVTRIAESEETIIRFSGQQYYDDWKVPSSEKKAILEMLQAEKALKEKFAGG